MHSKSDLLAQCEEGRDPDPILQLVEDHKKANAEYTEVWREVVRGVPVTRIRKKKNSMATGRPMYATI